MDQAHAAFIVSKTSADMPRSLTSTSVFSKIILIMNSQFEYEIMRELYSELLIEQELENLRQENIILQQQQQQYSTTTMFEMPRLKQNAEIVLHDH